MIQINDRYAVDVDHDNYALIKISTVSKPGSKNLGEKREMVIGYYSGLAGALRRAMVESQRDRLIGRDMSLWEAINEVRRSNDELKGIISRALEDYGE